MRYLLGAALAVALGACAAATPDPTMRPLTQAHIDAMGPTSVVVSENNSGVEKRAPHTDLSVCWFRPRWTP